MHSVNTQCISIFNLVSAGFIVCFVVEHQSDTHTKKPFIFPGNKDYTFK